MAVTAIRTQQFRGVLAQSSAVSSTTLTTFQTKVSQVVTGPGTFLVLYSAEASASSGTVDVRLDLDGTEIGDTQLPSTVFVAVSGIIPITLTAGSHTVSLQFRSTTSNKTVSIRRAVVWILRQS